MSVSFWHPNAISMIIIDHLPTSVQSLFYFEKLFDSNCNHGVELCFSLTKSHLRANQPNPNILGWMVDEACLEMYSGAQMKRNTT
jgi:hypothetical protein